MASTRLVVLVSLVASTVIAVAKFIAWLSTGNASMLSQVYYSLSDVGNQLLFLLGFRMSKAGASRKHPFGRGKEQYVFAFVVTMLLFGVTGYAAVREGYETVGTPARDVDVTINYIVLGVALLFESAAFYKSFQAVREEAETEGFGSLIETFRGSKDAPLLTAATENFVAVIGVLVALGGVYLTDVTDNTIYDAIGSAVIGLLLMGFALTLAWESRALLIGEGVTRRNRKRLLEEIETVPTVTAIVDLRTMHLGPESVLVACEIKFADGLSTTELEAEIDDVEAVIRVVVPEANRIYVEAESRDTRSDDSETDL